MSLSTNKILKMLFYSSLIGLYGCAPSNNFNITKEDDLKYSQISSCKTTNNWVKTDQKTYIAFDIVRATKNENSDYFLVLKQEIGDPFMIGDFLNLYINEQPPLRFELSILAASGKYISLSPATFERVVSIDKNILNKIIDATSIKFELQGDIRFTRKFKEATGTFSPNNIENLKQFKQSCL